MTDRVPDRRGLLGRLAPLGVLIVLGAALLVPAPALLELANPDRTRALEFRAALNRLPADPVVVLGFDPDTGTYAEIRPTVRVVLADLVARNARLVVVSLTPEGRALALAELGRLRDAVGVARITDLGYRAGAEAALVDLVDEVELADLALVVGGNDIGPRSWVEQVVPRMPELRLAAVAPTVLLPELLPYLGTGQLDALLATPRDGAAYRVMADPGEPAPLAEARPVGALAVLVGMLVALGVLLHSVTRPLVAVVRAASRRERA